MAELKPGPQGATRSCCVSHGEHGNGETADTAVDPVCGMTVDPLKTVHHATHAGRGYHFCSAGCLDKFVAGPERYLSQSVDRAAKAPAGSIWICPMHPEIRKDHPGACPICGMALEPEMVAADAGPSAD